MSFLRLLLLSALFLSRSDSFTTRNGLVLNRNHLVGYQKRSKIQHQQTLWLSSSNNNNNEYNQQQRPEYSQEVLLREEAESPFRKVRFFLYFSLGGAAVTSLLVSVARIAAGLSGINTDLLQESTINALIDLAGLIVIGLLWQRDVKAQESRLKRASKGALLAKLLIRGSKSMMEGYLSDDESDDNEMFTTSLASLRRGRGIEKRVVIAAGGNDKIQEIIKEAKQLNDSLVMNDLLIVPVIVPQIIPPEINEKIPECVALPVGSNWRVVVGEEIDEAKKQGIDVTKEGFCIILKKNGRVGQRTKGIYLPNMVGEVTARRDAGMDVKNI